MPIERNDVEGMMIVAPQADRSCSAGGVVEVGEIEITIGGDDAEECAAVIRDDRAVEEEIESTDSRASIDK
ncbi:hypothetical protein NHQ30_000339 [Ciborinia camelliae]|nr:hypothetical protein NHQ30_000339 [Ciborinia camelliae]